MRRIRWICFLLVLLPFALSAQGSLDDYRRAESFLQKNIDRLIFRTHVSPHWIEKTSRFWYKNNIREGKEFVFVDAEKNIRRRAFDHERLAGSLSHLLNKEVEAFDLPFDTFEYRDEGESIAFKVDTLFLQCDLKNYRCVQSEPKKKDKPEESESPNGKWIAFIKNFNLWIRDTGTGEEFHLTTDGMDKYDYAASRSWYWMVNESNPASNKTDLRIDVAWSSDSKKLVTYRTDRRRAKKLYLYQSMPDSGYRAQVWSYERALPGEEDLTMLEYIIFDVERRDQIPVDLKPLPTVVAWGLPTWFEDGKRLYFQQYERGYQTLHLLEIDAETGKTRTVLTETSETVVDTDKRFLEILDESSEVIWGSERDGWSHLYLFDWNTGALKNQITRGEFVVRSLVHVDEKERRVYFTAGGREKGRDPYLRHLYRVNLDGSGLMLLTPEDAEHEINLSPDKKFLVDNFSRVDLPPTSVLRRLGEGEIVRALERADIDDLLATGWRYPEPFTVKARDGKTDIYGVVFRPSNFDPSRKYPIIDGTYSGPQAVRSPKSFLRGCRNSDVPLAELGFIVITIDGLGTANRSKPFHDVSYKNLGDIGAEDHIGGLKQLAARYPCMDLTRVGIYGHSAGGYDAAHAMLTHPEFYRVGVASAGNHDHQMAKAWWPEHWMGFPVGDHYVEQSNLSLAENLEGKLLLVHGDMDNNVNPASTLRLAGEFIKANKDFDLLIIPNRRHGLGDDPYFIRRRWDYFVEYLLGVEPPNEYRIKVFDEKTP